MNRAYEELQTLGYITETTRNQLATRGITAVQLEQYISMRGAT